MPAAGAGHQSGRFGGVLPAVGAQRAASGHRGADGEGDPQLRPRREGRPGRLVAAGVLDLAVPGPRAGRVCGGRLGGRGAGLPSAGGGLDTGAGLGAARDRRSDPPGRRRTSAGRRGDRAGDLLPGRSAGPGAGLEAGRDRLGRRTRRHRELSGVLRRRRLCRHGLPARGPARDRRGGLLLGRTPAQPRPGPGLRGHHERLRRDRRHRGATRARARCHRPPGDQPGRVRPAGVRARRGPPHRPAAGADRDGAAPRRCPGALLDLAGRRVRPRDHPHRHRRPGRVEAAPVGLGRRPRVRLRREPGLPDPRWRALPPRREASAGQHRGRRRAGPPGPLPHRGRQPAGQGSSRRPRRPGQTATRAPER